MGMLLKKEDDSTTKDMYDDCVQTTYGRYPLTIASGKGCRLQTTSESGEGKEYLDFVSGIATCALGHSNSELASAISDQMNTVHHVSNLYYIPAQGAFAKWLVDNSCADKVFFCNSGAEANESAIKLARRHAHNRGISKPVIVTAKQSFHGRTLGAISATGQPKYHKGFGYGDQMVEGFEYVTYNDVEDLERIVAQIKGGDADRGLAAIMLEPLQGEGGIVPGEPEFFKRARELCNENGALLMLDEVQVGMGRSGTLWGYQKFERSDGVQPDVFTSAKALGGGVPIGAMMARGDAANVFGPGDHASTYGGNALACRAGLAVAEYFFKHDVLQNVRDRSEQLKTGLEGIVLRNPSVLGEVRGWGLLLGVVVKKPEGDQQRQQITAGSIVQEAMNQQLLLVPAGGDVVRFVPPLVVTEEDIQEALEKFERAVQSFAQGMP